MVQDDRRPRTSGGMRPPAWYWLVVATLVAWGAMGCFAFERHMTLGPDATGAADSYDRALFALLPRRYHWLYGAAVIAGLAGALALLVRSRLAQSLLLLSLIAMLVQFGWLFATTDVIAVRGLSQAALFPAIIVAIALFALWFAGKAAGRGWLA